jgi:hypothetical protein
MPVGKIAKRDEQAASVTLQPVEDQAGGRAGQFDLCLPKPTKGRLTGSAVSDNGPALSVKWKKDRLETKTGVVGEVGKPAKPVRTLSSSGLCGWSRNSSSRASRHSSQTCSRPGRRRTDLYASATRRR